MREKSGKKITQQKWPNYQRWKYGMNETKVKNCTEYFGKQFTKKPKNDSIMKSKETATYHE